MSRSNYAISDFLVDRHPLPHKEGSTEGVPHHNTTSINKGLTTNKKETPLAYGHRAIPLLIDQLSGPDQSEALKTVLSLDLANQEIKAFAIQNGLIESMKVALGYQDAVVRAQALTVLGKLCNMKSAQERMASDSVIPMVLNCLNDVPNVCIAACHTLQRFSKTYHACMMLINHKAISFLVPVIMNTTLEEALESSLDVFACLTSASDEAIIAALACDALPALQRSIGEFPDLVVKCCCNLAKHMQGKEAMVKAGLLHTFAGLLHHQNHIVQQRALSVLMLVCVVVEAKQQAVEIPMLVDHLIYILVVGEEGNEMDLQYAKATLILISEYPKGRAEVEKCITKYGGEKEPEIRKLLFARNA